MKWNELIFEIFKDYIKLFYKINFIDYKNYNKIIFIF